MTVSEPKRRKFSPTPSWLILALLEVEWLLFLLDWFQLPKWHKGYAVLIAVASVGVAFLLMLLWFVIALVFRFSFQFGIRSLLVLGVAVAIPCSWLAVEIKAAREQGKVENAIRALGGGVGWALNGISMNSRSLIVLPPLPRLQPLLGEHFFTYIAVVGLDNTQCTDADLESLKGLTQLEILQLGHTQVTDAGLKHLKGLAHLKELVVNETKVTDEGVEELELALPNCKIWR